MISIPEIRDVVMVDDHEGDIQIARLCYAKSKLSNPWVSFNDGYQFLSFLRLAHLHEARLPALVLLSNDIKPMGGGVILEKIHDLFGANKPFSCVTIVSDSKHTPRPLIKGTDEVLIRPRTISGFVEFFDSLKVRV